MTRIAGFFVFTVACGVADDRPQTADYVIDAVLVPYCGRAACHSSASAARGLAFDTIPNAQQAFTAFTRDGTPMVTPGDPTNSGLYRVLVTSDRPMPPDVPLPDADIQLIKSWIENGAAGFP